MTGLERRPGPFPENMMAKEVREAEFPKDLDGRLEVALSSLNATPKAITLLLLGETAMDTPILEALFKEKMSGSPMIDTGPYIASKYSKSLIESGLVAEEATFDRGRKRIGFRLTKPDGIKYGLPIAALKVKVEKENNTCVYPVFGLNQKARGEHRAPLTRAKILMSLASGNTTQADVCRDLGISHALAKKSFAALLDAGAIGYDSLTPQTGRQQVDFTLSENASLGEVKPVLYDAVITTAVAKACISLAKQGIQITASRVLERIPRKVKKGKKIRSIKNRINHALSGLADSQGFLVRGKYKGTKTGSDAWLTDKGGMIVRELLVPLYDALADGETLERLQKEVLPEVQENLGDYASEVGKLYFPYSITGREQEGVEKREKAALLLKNSGRKGITVQELSVAVGWGETTAWRYLVDARGRGNAGSVVKNGVNYFTYKVPRSPRARQVAS